MTESRWAIVPAGGTGSRYGAKIPKQYLRIAGFAVLDKVLQTFIESGLFQGIVVPVSVHDVQFPTLVSATSPIVKRIYGGNERSDSVRLGLEELRDQGAQDQDWIFVHDAVRPLITKNELVALQETTEITSCPGVVLGTPCADTLKRVRPINQYTSGIHSCVTETVDRSEIWHALTPQVFRLGDLLSALTWVLENSYFVTDESQAMECIGIESWIVPGRRSNIKLTHPEDLELIEAILHSREEQ